MSIASILSGQDAIAAAYGATGSESIERQRNESPAQERTGLQSGAQSDTVSISDEARQRAAELQTAAKEQTAAGEEYPLEAYSIPSWYVDLHGGYTTITAKLGDSWEESRTGYEKLGKDDQELFNEYADSLHSHFREALDENGISSDTGDYYHNFILNQSAQDNVRQDLYQRLQDDPRALELMQHFGISL